METAARQAALVIVPLAAAVQAEASVILPTSNPTCNAWVSGQEDISAVECTAAAKQLPPAANGITGVKLYLGDPGNSITFFSGNLASIVLSTNGMVSGSIASGMLIPLGYSFRVDGPGQLRFWTLAFTLFSAGGGAVANTTVEDQSGTMGSISGVTEMIMMQDFSDSDLRVEAALQLSWVSDTGSLQLTIPSDSFDFNVTGASDIPEPASISLTVAGLAALGWQLVRRRKDGREWFELRRIS